MVRSYLDIETYRERKEDAFIDEEVIAISVLEDWLEYSSESLSQEPIFKCFTEWEFGSERGC